MTTQLLVLAHTIYVRFFHQFVLLCECFRVGQPTIGFVRLPFEPRKWENSISDQADIRRVFEFQSLEVSEVAMESVEVYD